ncbi:MAG TPA: GspMb/PilO family protein [Vicinamibacterales bacterium]|nr:GspMb/PilO family protein [Vicinamibacterales bacterium]
MSLWARVYEDRRRVILPLAVLVAVAIAVLLLGVWPLQSRVAASETAALQARVELSTARRLERQAREAAANRTHADADLQTFYADVLPRDFATATRTTNRWLLEAAREAGLEFKASHFDWAPVRDSRLSRAFSTVTLSGNYASIRRFLYAMETASEFIVVEQVGLAEASSTRGNSGTLDVSLSVSTYFLSPAAGQ